MERTDEPGVLASSFNTMSHKLDAAMEDLESTGTSSCASHELKTPGTILKGQIESMILGIGSYKNTKR